MADHLRMITDEVDLVYSSDERIWYFQKYGQYNGDLVVSASYMSQDYAMKSWREGKVTWFSSSH